jgi:molybdopterin converting factor small subunit
MIEIHLYGRLRRFSEDRSPTSASIARVKWEPGDTVRCVVDRLGIPHEELGSNIFLNGAYATLDSPVQDADRLGLFPNDIQLLYKWYFAPRQDSATPNQESADLEASNLDKEGEK